MGLAIGSVFYRSHPVNNEYSQPVVASLARVDYEN
jgi:hypothetical protein